MTSRKKLFWIAGTIVAFSGVAIARILPGYCSGDSTLAITSIGITIAFVGLLIIALGSRK
jgi:hypothetical protein